MFEQHFVQQLLVAVRPQIKAPFNEVIADQRGQPLIVDYEEAGRIMSLQLLDVSQPLEMVDHQFGVRACKRFLKGDARKGRA